MQTTQVAQAHLDFDIAVEQAQAKLYRAHEAVEDKFEESREEIRVVVNQAVEVYDQAVAAYNLAMVACRAAEQVARVESKDTYASAREEYEAEIAAARQAYRAVLQQTIEEG